MIIHFNSTQSLAAKIIKTRAKYARTHIPSDESMGSLSLSRCVPRCRSVGLTMSIAVSSLAHQQLQTQTQTHISLPFRFVLLFVSRWVSLTRCSNWQVRLNQVNCQRTSNIGYVSIDNAAVLNFKNLYFTEMSHSYGRFVSHLDSGDKQIRKISIQYRYLFSCLFRKKFTDKLNDIHHFYAQEQQWAELTVHVIGYISTHEITNLYSNRLLSIERLHFNWNIFVQLVSCFRKFVILFLWMKWNFD